jgi:hypothetical protein
VSWVLRCPGIVLSGSPESLVILDPNMAVWPGLGHLSILQPSGVGVGDWSHLGHMDCEPKKGHSSQEAEMLFSETGEWDSSQGEATDTHQSPGGCKTCHPSIQNCVSDRCCLAVL